MQELLFVSKACAFVNEAPNEHGIRAVVPQKAPTWAMGTCE
jgi:hypothetical protein